MEFCSNSEAVVATDRNEPAEPSSFIDTNEMELVSQGAEGKLYRHKFLSRPAIVKVRVSKSYRVGILDKKLNRQRLLQETRCMAKCSKAGILTPALYLVDQQRHTIVMEEIIGRTMKDTLKDHASTGMHSFGYNIVSVYDVKFVWGIGYVGDCIDIAKNVGIAIGKMHEADIGKYLKTIRQLVGLLVISYLLFYIFL